MMRPLFKPLPMVFIVQLALIFFLSVIPASGESFVIPVPDKSKMLPANDGGPDGCDSSRFKCVMEGQAVLDKQTGLIWSRDTYSEKKPVPWQEAVKFCENVEIGGKKGWRLPTRDELITVFDTSQVNPALPEGHPFIVPEDFGTDAPAFWTSTEYEGDDKSVWIIAFRIGKVMDDLRLFDNHFWPVRDGE